NDLDKIAAAQGPVRPMPYSTVDFQSQSTTRLGETKIISDVLNEGTWQDMKSGLRPVAFIPTGAKNVEIHLKDRGADDDIQLFSQNGKHLIGTPVEGTDADPSSWEGTEADYTWKNNDDGIPVTSAEDVETNIFTLANGFPEGTTYSSDKLINPNSYSEDLTAGTELKYEDMTFTYTGDGDRFDTNPNDGKTFSTDSMIEKLNIDKIDEPLFLLVSGNGKFDIKATWDDMPGASSTGGVDPDNTPIGRV
ncbi:hypothetical protein QC823_16145, partial [Halomonas vilamensis]